MLVVIGVSYLYEDYAEYLIYKNIILLVTKIIFMLFPYWIECL